MTKNLERISPWWDRRVMGGLLVAVLPGCHRAPVNGMSPNRVFLNPC